MKKTDIESIKGLCDEILTLCIRRMLKESQLTMTKRFRINAMEKGDSGELSVLCVKECKTQEEIIELNRLIEEKDSDYEKLTGHSFVKLLKEENGR